MTSLYIIGFSFQTHSTPHDCALRAAGFSLHQINGACILTCRAAFPNGTVIQRPSVGKGISNIDCRLSMLSLRELILFPKAFHCLNSYVRVSTVDPRSSHTALSLYTNERARTRPLSLLTKPVAKLGTVLTRTCAPQKLVHTTCFVILHWGSLL